MTNEPTATSSGVAIPKTCVEALNLWDAKQPVPAFRVEEEDSEQEQIYWAAFEVIRARLLATEATASMVVGGTLSDRERDIALAIANTALRFGWRKMLEMHTDSGHVQRIVIQRSQEMKTVPELEAERAAAGQ